MSSGLPDWSPRHFGAWDDDDAPAPVAEELVTDLVGAGRALGSGELLVLLGAMVEQSGVWEALADLARTGDDEAVLHSDEDVEVRVVHWTGRERESGWHDHDRSASAVRVLLGALVEHTLGDAGRDHVVRIGAGASYPFEPEHVHRLDAEVAGTLSLHAWSPPLETTGLYEIDPSGRLRRVAVDL
ncbi:MAG: cysteine dioxygenase type [Nocardioidaceae bacterium]|nr:cysteine dioxygenase type [Nocardioidaceae bacterium]